MQHSLLNFWVWVYDSVMVGNCGTSLWSLRNDIEIVVSDNLLRDEGTCRWVVDFAVYCKKSLCCFSIDQSHRESDITIYIDILNGFYNWLDKKLLEKRNLIAGTGILQNYYLIWHTLVSLAECTQCSQQQNLHRFKLVLVTFENFGASVN